MMTKTKESGRKIGYQSPVAGEDGNNDSGLSNRPIIDKNKERVHKNYCKCTNRDRWGGHVGIFRKKVKCVTALEGRVEFKIPDHPGHYSADALDYPKV